MKTEAQTPDQGPNSMLSVSAAGKSWARLLAPMAARDPRVRSWVITMSFDERGELRSYLECSLDENDHGIWGGGYERCEEGWRSFAISADAGCQHSIGEA